MNRQEYSPLKQNKIISIDSLHPHPRNYRNHTEKQIANLITSLTRFGQGRSIVAQDGPNGYLIVAGHGIVEAAKQLHYTELRADILPADWTSDQITGYLVADNLHANEASDDNTLLAHLLQEQEDAGYDLASLGSDEESLRQMLQSLGNEYLRGGSDEDQEGKPDVQFKEYDESIEEGMDTEMCQQCGKVCLKSGKGKK